MTRDEVLEAAGMSDNSAVTRFSDGSTRGSQSVQKCKPKK
jgi:hypothetical protein